MLMFQIIQLDSKLGGAGGKEFHWFAIKLLS